MQKRNSIGAGWVSTCESIASSLSLGLLSPFSFHSATFVLLWVVQYTYDRHSNFQLVNSFLFFSNSFIHKFIVSLFDPLIFLIYLMVFFVQLLMHWLIRFVIYSNFYFLSGGQLLNKRREKGSEKRSISFVPPPKNDSARITSRHGVRTGCICEHGHYNQV